MVVKISQFIIVLTSRASKYSQIMNYGSLQLFVNSLNWDSKTINLPVPWLLKS